MGDMHLGMQRALCPHIVLLPAGSAASACRFILLYVLRFLSTSCKHCVMVCGSHGVCRCTQNNDSNYTLQPLQLRSV
jgi:hypothetical protein